MEQLLLLQETKISEMLGGQVDPRLEASGVLAKDSVFYVIFDKLADIACLDRRLSPESSENRLIRQKHGRHRGFEDIAYDPWSQRYYILIESVPGRSGLFMAKVQEYDQNLHYQSDAWLDFTLQRPNKGLEGLTCIHRDGETLLLGLCEGNKCKAGAEGRKPGGGRIQVFRRGQKHWDRVNLALRGLQQYRGGWRPPGGCVSGQLCPLGRKPGSVEVGHRRRGDYLHLPSQRRRSGNLLQHRGCLVD